MWMDLIIQGYLEYICGKDNVLCDYPLSRATSFRIGGNAKFFVRATSKDVFIKAISALSFSEIPYFILGGGSNILARDEGFDGVVIKPCFTEIVQNDGFLYVDAGCLLPAVCKFAQENGLSGMDFAIGIPGTIGGAIYMNAGAYGGEMKDICAIVDIWNGEEIISLNSIELEFGYRKSIFQEKKNWSILGAYLHLTKAEPAEIKQKQLEFLKRRISSQPKEPSAGSIFRKPSDNFYVGKAVEELGLKGKSIGGAQISDIHAGFIVNKGGATCSDVLALVELIKKAVYDKHGIMLEEEITLL